MYVYLVFAEVNISEANGSNTTGTLFLHQASPQSPVIIEGTLYNLESGVHGFHVHENGDTGNDCIDAGGHFNPTNVMFNNLYNLPCHNIAST